MKIIVGLGNPGKKYEKTRHNLGFMVLEQFLKDFQPVGKTVWENSTKFKSDITQIDWQPKHGNLEKIILVKPKTFMNNSGMAVQLLLSFYKVKPEDLWVVHDEIDLPLGNIKIRLGGGDAGHRGIMSIRETLGSDRFWRFRLGIGHPKAKIQNSKIKIQNKNVDEYVVGAFVGGEWGKARELIKRGAKALEMALEDSLEAAMNRFNTK